MLIILAVLGLARCAISGSEPALRPSPAPSPTVSSASARDHSAPIEPVAITPYTRNDYPDVVRQFGKLIPTINAERNQVAKIVASNPACDGVENVQITNGATKVARRYVAECANLTRYFFDKNSLAKGVPARIQTKDDMLRNGLMDW